MKTTRWNHELRALLTIAYRDVTKLLRDRLRLGASLVFPVIFLAVLGGSLNESLSVTLEFEYMAFLFTGIFAQTMFASTMSGVIWIIRDREDDFSKELFIAPISRYTVIAGKILGESLVGLVQVVGIVIVALFLGVTFTFAQAILLIPVAFASAFLGGALGILILGTVSSERTATQLFPFLIFPQYFLAGVFTPLSELPSWLVPLSKIVPMTYAVDMTRSAYYAGTPHIAAVTSVPPLASFAISLFLFVIFLVVGTTFFVRKERNK